MKNQVENKAETNTYSHEFIHFIADSDRAFIYFSHFIEQHMYVYITYIATYIYIYIYIYR